MSRKKAHSIAPAGHSSTQAPHSVQTSGLMTAISPTVMADEGHASAHAPHATQSASITLGISITS